MLTVMGIIGYTHGVSDVRTPAVNANRKAAPTPRDDASAKDSAWACPANKRTRNDAALSISARRSAYDDLIRRSIWFGTAPYRAKLDVRRRVRRIRRWSAAAPALQGAVRPCL